MLNLHHKNGTPRNEAERIYNIIDTMYRYYMNQRPDLTWEESHRRVKGAWGRKPYEIARATSHEKNTEIITVTGNMPKHMTEARPPMTPAERQSFQRKLNATYRKGHLPG